MRAELVVQTLVGAFAEQIEIEVAQDRRKAIGVVERDDVIAVARAQRIGRRAIRQSAGKQSGIVNTIELRCLAVRIDRFHVRRIWQKRPHDGFVVLAVGAEVVKRIGMPTFDDRIGFCTQLGHETSFVSDAIASVRSVPESGTRSQSGRCANSYSIS